MNIQLSQDYNIDNRYGPIKNASDNPTGLSFLRDYINRMRDENWPRATLNR